ncbi:MAG TPA: PAS domain S-box protein [Candidatus Sulfotelmatobacter sp.]|jgi:PAS domain S-box-containing protein|nr:PAS domain S-box protein [Candidatus Sulfotelmatobacter sp.]
MTFRKVIRDRISLLVVMATLAAILVFGVTSRDNYAQMRQERLARLEDQAEKSLVAFQAQASHLFDYGDGLLRSARYTYLRNGLPALDGFVRAAVSPRAEMFQGTLTIADGIGHPLFHSTGPVVAGTNLAERDYFRYFRENPQDSLYVGPTNLGTITRQWWFRLVRPILDGRNLNGVVILSMRPDYMVELYQNLALGPHSSVQMLTLEHQLVSRLPRPPETVYMTAIGDQTLWTMLAQTDHGRYHAVDAVDGLGRTYFFKRLDDYGVVVEVGYADRDVEDSLIQARWNETRQSLLFTLSAVIFCLLVLSMRVKSLALAERDVQLSLLLAERAGKLADSEARFKGLVEQSLVGIYVVEAGRFTYVNPALCGIFGYQRPEDMLKLSPLDLVSPLDRAMVEQALNHRDETEDKSIRLSFRGIRNDDNPVDLTLHGHSFRSPETGKWVVLGALMDNSESRRNEAEVRALNAELNRRVELGIEQQRAMSARWAMVLETAAEGMIGLDDESRVIFLNPAAADLLGIPSAEQVLGLPISFVLEHRLSDGGQCSQETCRIHQTLLNGETHRVSDEFFSGPDGDPLPVEYVVSPLKVEGETVGAVMVFHDVSDRREAQEQIAHLLAYQRAILNNTPVGITIVDQSRHILQTNPAFCRIYGGQTEDFIGAPTSVLYRNQEEFEDIGLRAYPLIASGQTFRDEVQMRRIDGSEVWISLEGHLVDSDRLELGIVWAVTDITVRKTLDMELRRSNEELERFAYVASHDLRQPLRMVSSYLSLLNRSMTGRLDDEEKEFFGFAIDGAKRMDRMIVDLLEYSRIGRAATERKRVSLAELLERVRFNLSGIVAEAEGQIILAADLPEISGYESELERLFMNLIGNALKFRIEGRAPQVSVAWEDRPEGWVISVSDNGIGIPPEQHQRLFQIFQRLVTREQYEGTGIGLASCRKIVEHHHGRIWVESQPGEGSRFFVLLPK